MPWAGAALERSGTLTRGRAGSRAVLGGKMEWKVAAISLGRTMGWTMLIFKRIKRYLFFTSKKMIVLLIVLPDVIPFGLAPGSLWAGLGPGGEILSYHK